MDNQTRIWEGYKQFKTLAYVVRSGFGYYGVYPIHPDDLKPRQGRKALPESDLEHVAGMMKLIRLISWYYPEIIPKERLDDYLYGAEIHEMGEVITGDIPDDGTRNEHDKDFLETVEIRRYLSKCAPNEEMGRGMQIYKEMRDKNTEFGRALYFIDKLEAILQGIYYESIGHPGRISFKQNNYGQLSKREKNQREYTNSDRMVDAWSHGFLAKAESLKFEHTDEFFAIILAAIREVRGRPFSWID